MDDHEYASGELSEEIALNIASDMESSGFDVVNLPDRCDLYKQNPGNIHLFDWS